MNMLSRGPRIRSGAPVYPIQLKIKNTNYTNYANASHKYCTCAERNSLYRPTHLCVAHLNCTKTCSQFFLWCGKVGGCLERGGGDDPCFRR